MKKFISMLAFTCGLFLYSYTVEGGCTRTKSCGNQGDSLSCSGTHCTGSGRLETNPWVECDGVRNYCTPPQA
ncbi:hypothetical protein [Algoriphagus sediminis]|uniref:Membrane or secreted protein n=1 Tax=Algoriphagus sediminis TaxID=3057113 RepID=A0ABT7YG06_9BACT|nr:hypothetical protein [Algoriphagus sediminis]MDN3205462.1 hypothetical protein [Algoriphagus sediminis]